MHPVVAMITQQQPLSLPRLAFEPDAESVVQSVVAVMIQQHPSLGREAEALVVAVLQSDVAAITQQQPLLASACALAAAPPAACVVQSVVATSTQQQDADGGCGAFNCRTPPFEPFKYSEPVAICFSSI